MVDSRLEDPHISEGGMLAVIWVQTALAMVFVAFRVAIRLSQKDKSTLDDGFVVLAMACMIVVSALYTPIMPAIYLVSELERGMLTELPKNFIEVENRFLRYQFAIIILFWTVLWSVKAAFLVFYKQLFGNGFAGPQLICWWIVAAITLVTYIVSIIIQFFACSPLSTYFHIGECISERDVRVSNSSLYYGTAVDIACDLLIMILPISILFHLRKDVRTRLALGALFLTGFLIILFSILRLTFTIPDRQHVNPKWLAVWSTTEEVIAIAVSCAPPFRRFFVGRTPKRGTASSSGGGYKTSSRTDKVKSAATTSRVRSNTEPETSKDVEEGVRLKELQAPRALANATTSEERDVRNTSFELLGRECSEETIWPVL